MKKVFALLMLGATLSFVACEAETEVNDEGTEEVETMEMEEEPMMEEEPPVMDTTMQDTTSAPAEAPAETPAM